MNHHNKRLTKEEQKLAILENQRLHELTHQLVVKIIIWKSGKLDSTSITKSNKVTPQEWNKYQNHMLNISKTESVERVKDKLNQTKQDIRDHGGFA